MLDETEFGRVAAAAIEALKQHLIAREDEAEAGLEVEEQAGALNVLLKQQGGKFVVAPNAPMRQVWIAAPAESLKLDWNATAQKFILPRSGEPLIQLMDRLIDQHLEQ